jgi:FRG domain
METLDLNDWDEFQETLRILRRKLEKASEGRDRDLRGLWTYRGQSTLERYDPDLSDCVEYYRKAHAVKHHIEALTGRTMQAPGVQAYRDLLAKDDDPFRFDDNEAYGYLTYLRHHGFPSPLLDWTVSPYVAAFFAFRDAQPSSERVAVFAFCEFFGGNKLMAAGEPSIHGRGPYVTTDPRHVLQQCRYTTCSARIQDRWKYLSHQAVFDEEDPILSGQDVLCKMTLPVALKEPVLEELDRYNLNAHTLFGTEDSLIETVARRHWSRNK